MLLLGLNGYSQVVNVASGLVEPYAITIDGNDLYINEATPGTVVTVDATLTNQTTSTLFANVSFLNLEMVRFGNYLYLVHEDFFTTRKIVRVDATTGVSSNYILDNAYKMVLVGNFLYFSDPQAGTVSKVDLTQPTPVVTQVVQGLINPGSLAINGNDLYIAEDGGTTIYKIDITQTNPIIDVAIVGLSDVQCIRIHNNTMYIAEFIAGKISTADLTQTSPTAVMFVPSTEASSMAIRGNELFFTHFSNGEVNKIGLTPPVVIDECNALFDDFRDGLAWVHPYTTYTCETQYDRIMIDNGTLNFRSANTNSFNYIYRTGLAISDTDWKADIEFTPTAFGLDGGVGHNILSLNAGIKSFYFDDTQSCFGGTSTPCSFPGIAPCTVSAQEGIAVTFNSNAPSFPSSYSYDVNLNDGLGNISVLASITTGNIAGAGTNYISLERIGTTSGTLSVYSDAARTIHIPNSPVSFAIPAAIDGLNTVNMGVIEGGYFPRRLSATLDNLCITNTISNDCKLLYVDADGDGYDNGRVTDCSGTVPTGFSATTLGTDCDDSNAANNVLMTYFFDADGDGYNNGTVTDCSTIPPAGTSTTTLGADCDDTNPATHNQFSFYIDGDGDGFGSTVSNLLCAVDAVTPPAGYSINDTDCDDTNPLSNQFYPFHRDADGDGYGVNLLTLICALNATTPPPGYTLVVGDCNDNNPLVRGEFLFFLDSDGDGYGGLAQIYLCAVNGSTPPAGFSTNSLDCNDSNSSINPGATEICDGIDNNCNGSTDEGCGPTTPINPLLCGTTLTNIGSIINAVGVGSGANYLFEVTDVGPFPVAPIVQTYVTGGSPNFSLTSLPSFHYATTYSIRVMIFINGAWSNAFSAPCLISTPNVVSPTGQAQVDPSQCGATLTSLSTLIATTSLPHVDCYRFKVTDLTTGQVQTITRGYHWFSLTMLSNYNYGTTYSIEVAVSTDCVNFTPFGNSCNVTTRAVPSLGTYCGTIIPTKSTMITTTSLPHVSMYHFEVTRLDSSGSPVGTPKDIFKNNPQNYFTLNDLQALPNNIYAPNTNYSVKIRVMSAGTWSPFGLLPCVITSPNIARMIEEEKPAELFEVMAYPNPFNHQFEITLQSTDSSNVSIKVYDMVGRMLYSKEVKSNEVSVQQLGDNYPTGVYNVIVSQSNNQRSFRIIKR